MHKFIDFEKHKKLKEKLRYEYSLKKKYAPFFYEPYYDSGFTTIELIDYISKERMLPIHLTNGNMLTLTYLTKGKKINIDNFINLTMKVFHYYICVCYFNKNEIDPNIPVEKKIKWRRWFKFDVEFRTPIGTCGDLWIRLISGGQYLVLLDDIGLWKWTSTKMRPFLEFLYKNEILPESVGKHLVESVDHFNSIKVIERFCKKKNGSFNPLTLF
jgi:hypothetical protein